MDICKEGIELSVTAGSVLNGPANTKNPRIGIADGGHFNSMAQGLIMWGENLVHGKYSFLKERNWGVKVYARPIGCNTGGWC
jgi:hypothetical protein